MRKLNAYGPSLVVLITAFVVLLAGPAAVRRLTYAQTEARIVQASDRLAQSDVLEQLNQAYSDIAALVEPSVVHISSTAVVKNRFGQRRLSLSSGSGWIYDEQGHIVTNEHVVKDAQSIEVQLHTGERRSAHLVGRDLRTDIAVIKVAPGLLHPARPGTKAPVRQGDLVFAFGSPFDFRFSMSSGIVSGLGRYAGLMDIDYQNFIQVDAAINPGNSGGPLTDIHGRVIGMNTAIATGRGRSVGEGQFGGIGLAIPMSMIASVVEQLIERGEVDRGYLGVSRMDEDLSMARSRGFHGQGVEIGEVVPGSPADRAGMLSNDVITRVDDEEIGTIRQLMAIISSHRPGETVDVGVWRYDEDAQAGSRLTLTLSLVKFDLTLLARGAAGFLQRVGLDSLVTSTEARAGEFGVRFHRGVLVEHVAPSSVYVEAIEPGSIIIAVEDETVSNLDDLYALVARHGRPRGVQITLITPDGHRERLPLVLR